MSRFILKADRSVNELAKFVQDFSNIWFKMNTTIGKRLSSDEDDHARILIMSQMYIKMFNATHRAFSEINLDDIQSPKDIDNILINNLKREIDEQTRSK